MTETYGHALLLGRTSVHRQAIEKQVELSEVGLEQRPGGRPPAVPLRLIRPVPAGLGGRPCLPARGDRLGLGRDRRGSGPSCAAIFQVPAVHRRPSSPTPASAGRKAGAVGGIYRTAARLFRATPAAADPVGGEGIVDPNGAGSALFFAAGAQRALGEHAVLEPEIGYWSRKDSSPGVENALC